MTSFQSPSRGGVPDPALLRGPEAAPTRRRPRGSPVPQNPSPDPWAPQAMPLPGPAGRAYHGSSRRRLSAWDGTSGYSPDTRVWVSRRPQAPGGKPKGPPSGKEGKPTWEADESQKQPPLRGSARAVRARPSRGRFKGRQGQLPEPFQPSWEAAGAAPPPRIT